MKSPTSRSVAILLASLFAVVASVVIAGVVVRYLFDSTSTTSSTRHASPNFEGEPPAGNRCEAEEADGRQNREPRDAPLAGGNYCVGTAEFCRERREVDPPHLDEEDPPEALDDFHESGPRMIARGPDDRQIRLPMVQSDYDVDIRGDLATVTIEQTFENPGEVPLNAQYQLPMAEDAAVYAMKMRVGDTVVRGEVKEKQEAEKIYEEAKQEGKAAALLEQQRANVFTQKLANVMPDKPVDVTIRYMETVEKRDGEYQLVVPLVVGPRYEPGDMSDNALVEDGEEADSDAQSVGALPPVSELQAPQTIEPDRIGLDVRLDGGVPVREVRSRSHAIATRELDPRNRDIRLARGRTIGNRHFVLSYELAGRSPQAGLLTHWDEDLEQGYFSLLVEPPSQPDEDEVAAREMVFLLDTSGSMRGAPMETAKTYMRQTLRNLRPSDSFRIVEFSSDTGALSGDALAANEANVQRGIDYVDRLTGGGGTEMVPGIERALRASESGDRVRMVTVLSDGYVGNEYEIVEMVRRELGDARMFVLGIGSATNQFALEEMAEVGRGFTRYLHPRRGSGSDEQIRDAALGMADKLETPVLTDLSVDWDGLAPRETTPARIPDLFAGESVRVMGRYDEPGEYEVTVTGRAGGEPVEIPLEVELPGKPTDGRAVELTWARSRVDDFMHRLTTPDDLRRGELDDEGLKARVKELGLTHDLATKWTSFVAVSDRVVNPNPGASADAQVPEPKAANVPAQGYGLAGKGSGSPAVSGTPEPTTLGSLLLALLTGLGVYRRR